MSARIGKIRWKIIAAVAASLALAIMSSAVLVQVVRRIGVQHRGGLLYGFLQSARRDVGVGPLSTMATVTLFLFFFYLLTRRSVRYIETISRTLQQVSLGRLDLEVPPRLGDELGELGANINRMTSRLRVSLEEERRAGQAQRELITSVSHDLKTPLTSILGYLELIGKPTTDPAEMRRYADVALQKTRQLTKLTDDLFEYTNVSHRALTIRRQPIDLKALLIQLAEEYVPVLQASGMEYRLNASEGQYIVQADGDLLVRVFENLIANAIHHGRAGRFVGLELAATAARVTVRVVNYGDPIPQAIPRVFDRFFRVDPSRTEHTGGAGLGLAIAKSIVELHGGEIAVHSDRTGTTFSVSLKREPDPGDTQPDAPGVPLPDIRNS